MMFDPYCERHGTFHPAGRCETIDELRANVVPIHPDQMELFAGPKVLCAGCGYEFRVTDLDSQGRCSACVVPLSELLARSLRARGVEPNR
jgi:predicted Zn-ribbon and HTH transcriptional regulator